MENKSSSPRTVWIILSLVILAIVVSGSVAVGLYASRIGTGQNGANSTSPANQQVSMSQAVQIFKNYLGSIQNTNIALHEVEEYQYNFYAAYYEKDTGNFAFQMVIWKTGTTYMMGMMGYTGATGIAVPEMGPNMMWNTKYHVTNGMMGWNMMGGNGMMGSGQGSSTPMTVTSTQAKTFAQQYLNNTLPGKIAGDADTFYGYYNIDVLTDGLPYGMLSVNGFTGQVWYHTWHGTYMETVTIS